MPPAGALRNIQVASRTVLIDGNSLIHRAYHALPPLSTATGQPTNAAYGFVQMILLLLESVQPGVAILCMDAPGPTFRHEQFPQYKAHRPEMDPELGSQFPLIHELSEAMGLAITELPGWEADDIIGALSRRAAERGDEVLIVSGDRDEVQLVRPGVELLAPIKGMTQTKTYDEAAVHEEYGVSPAQIIDLKGLAGDSSDNIPGVPKVGPKTARDLLRQFGTMEEMFSRLEEVGSEKLRDRLREHEEVARLSKALATIATDAPVDGDLLDRTWPGLDTKRLRRLLAELGFLSLVERLPAEETQDTGFATVQGDEAVAELCAKLRQAPLVGIALALEGERPVALALAAGEAQVVVVPLQEAEITGGLFAEAEVRAVPHCLSELLADPTVRKAGADLKGTARALDGVGVPLRGFGFDTDLAAYLIAPHRSDRGLEALLAQHFGETLPSGTEGLGSGSGTPASWTQAAVSARAVLRLRQPLERQLEEIGERDLFEHVELPLAEVLRDMELAGIAVDVERLNETGDKLSGLMLATSRRIYQLAGEEFNLDSPKQIAGILFEKLHLPKGRKTKTGWSTNADVLEELAPDHEIVALILQYREFTKLKSTYVDSLVRLVSPEDGRVRTTFEQTVAATGRLSSRNPNLQNIPVRTDWGREIRSCFVAAGDDHVLVSADYSQIELRILAHMSGDDSLLSSFAAGEDVHRRTASRIFDVPVEQVTSEMRRVAKTVNYAVIYGMGATALAKQLGIKRPEAQRFIDHYFEHLPRVKDYMTGVVEHGRQDGYVTTLCGRRRPLPELQSSDPRGRAYAERAAANAPLQGTAADIIKIAMVRLAERLPQVAPQSRMLLQVHDELVFELPRQEVGPAVALMREVMSGAVDLEVPLDVDVKVGQNWRDMTEV
jgi:DNA polymerase-1